MRCWRKRKRVLAADVDFAVGDGWHGEFDRAAGCVAAGILGAVVEFLRDVGGVVGVENGGAGREVVGVSVGLNRPDDAVCDAVGRDALVSAVETL